MDKISIYVNPSRSLFFSFRGSNSFEIGDLLQGAEAHMPLHLITFFQEEDVLTTEMNKSATNPFTFKTCDLDSYSYRMADNKFPSSLFSCSGIGLRHIALIIDQLAYHVAT